MLVLKLLLLVLPLALKFHLTTTYQLSLSNSSAEELVKELQEFNSTRDVAKLDFPSILDGSNPAELEGFGFVAGLDELNSVSGFGKAMEKGLTDNWSKISKKCQKNVVDFIKGLLGRKKQLWALQMFDSSSRLPSGLASGNIVDLGFFDECLAIEATIDKETVLGKHCIGNLPNNNISAVWPKDLTVDYQTAPRVIAAQKGLGYQFSLCVPNTCSAQDLEYLFFEKFRFYEDLCQTKEHLSPALDGAAIGAISFFGVILAIIAASTVYDTYLHVTEKDALHPILLAFSAVTNVKKLVKTSTSPDQLLCLHGMRVISTIWVILGHRYIIQLTFPVRNYAEVTRWFESKSSMFVLNLTLAVDTFFLMSGMMVAYVFLSAAAKGAKFNILAFYRHRYLRLTPVIAAIILVHATLIKYFGTGPYFPSALAILVPACQEKWWKALLYIQNYGTDDSSDTCISQTWYLSIDMQLFVLSPLLLLPLKRWPFPTIIATVILTLCSTAASFATGWILELSSHALGLGNTFRGTKADHYKWIYISTYVRAAPWLIGFILGYYVFQVKQGKLRIKMNKGFALLLWMAAMAVLCTCVFTAFNMMYNYNRLVDSLHIALVRPAWAIGLSWVVLGCISGQGGPVDWFLSLPLFQVVSKLTYTLYLVHFQIISISIARMRVPPTFGNEEMMYIVWGDIAASLAVALILTLAFESPMVTIEQVLFGKGKKKAPKSVSTASKSPVECA